MWTNKESYAVEDGLKGLTEKESKLASYWNTPFKKICLGMTVNGDRRWNTFDYEASSLYIVIKDGTFRPTYFPLYSLKSLISGSSLQANCNRQGFNFNSWLSPNVFMHPRFGLVANNEWNCDTCDSWIGLGAEYAGCGKTSMACGNRAVCYATKNVNIPSFGYVFVQ